MMILEQGVKIFHWKSFALVAICFFQLVYGDAQYWTKSKPLTVCSGTSPTITFSYNQPSLSFANFSAVTWSVKKPTSTKSEYLFYLNSNDKENILFAPTAKTQITERIEWIKNSLNFKLKQVYANDSGLYDVQFTIFNAGTIYSNKENGTFHLIVNDPCVKAVTADDGCTDLTCSTRETNPVYSWNGDAADKTTESVKVCPSMDQQYKCCVDDEKMKCMEFYVSAVVKQDEVYVNRTMSTDGKKEDGAKIGMIVGIVFGCIIAVVTAIVIGVIVCKRRGSGYSAARTSG